MITRKTPAGLRTAASITLATLIGLAKAGSFLATLPLLALFVIVGRRMVAGIPEGAFKG